MMTEYEEKRLKNEQRKLALQAVHILVTMGIPFVLFILERVFK
jgi:hypothetical protein